MNHNVNPNIIACIDMVSFYSSCEAVSRGLDPLKVKLVVVGDPKNKSSVVLAASPVMKRKYNIKTGSRLYEVMKIIDPEIIITGPRMEHYLKIAKDIQTIFNSFVPSDSIHIYSVDEAWLTLNGTQKLWGTPYETVAKIIIKIKEKTGCVATAGIGDNKFQAKFCLDVYGKKDGIAITNSLKFREMFHHLPVQNMWGIGPSLSQRLNKMNIYKVGDISNANVIHLKEKFGKVGKRLYEQSFGIDNEPVFYDPDNPPTTSFSIGEDAKKKNAKSLSKGITFNRNITTSDEVISIIKELLVSVCSSLRKSHLTAKTLQITITYSRTFEKKGINKQLSFKDKYSNDPLDYYPFIYKIVKNNLIKNAPVRFIRVSLNKTKTTSLESLDNTSKRVALISAADEINSKFGEGIIRPAFSFKNNNITEDRLTRIGGHKKDSDSQKNSG